MNLKNYTSSVPVERSVMNIEHHLVRAGAGHIAKSYDTNGVLTGITFQIVKGNVNTVFKLPAKWEKCFEVMFKEVRKPRPETRERVKEQAQRTAWKILHDWVEIQVSLIQLEQADVREVFLPYMYDMKLDQTLFERLRDSNFKLLGEGK